MLPIVAIVGRPNVGKSSLLNRVAGRMISIVDPTPGVTRDRISTPCHHEGRYFELVDTGGVGIVDADNLTEHVTEQIRQAVEQAALILFTLDAREGVLPLDLAVARMLRPHSDKVMVLANKADTASLDVLSTEFFQLGYGAPLPISAEHGRNVPELLDRVADFLFRHGLGGEELADEVAEPEIKIAIVGKRNAGKSTMINAIAGAPRVITSEVPGTTRDAVDVRIVKDGRRLLVIDTAGVRKRKSIKGDIDYYSTVRAERSIRRADVVLLVIDATEPISIVDKKLGHYIVEQFKPVILVVNKFDLVKDKATSGDYADYLDEVLSGLHYAPIVLTTATEGKNVNALLDLAVNLFKQASTRVSTGQLNAAVEQISGARGPGAIAGPKGPAKIYYATQVAVRPPTIVLMVKAPQMVPPAFERFLLNRFREMLPFKEVPIRLMMRERSGRQAAKDMAEPKRHGPRNTAKKQPPRGGPRKKRS